ncbi:MAG: three-Cys-motif partner protein TcmP [Chloroflexi bacterium]|nr:three-Cys-motif partner protein TcmP [Chloroflexota bacterium]
MTAPRTTIWDLEAHSRAKHDILGRYLQSWVPILAQGGFPELAYIDGFAGPGRYSKGEDGSPIIALKAALENADRIGSKVTFLFVEEREDRAATLQDIVDEMRTEIPTRFTVKVEGGRTFEQAARAFLMQYTEQGTPPPPTFAFIDPFGWTGIPFSLVEAILSYRSCEVLVTFMYEEINRFIGHPDQAGNFDSFFGTTEWRTAIALATSRDRNRYLHNLYLNQLRQSAKAQYARSFEMRNDRDVADYYLFYATNSMLGLKKMKESMWRVDPSGEFTFSDVTDPRQLVLFAKEPQFDILRPRIVERFRGREVMVRDVEEFVVAETAFRETHYKRQVLRQMELATPPLLFPVDPPPNRAPGTYPDPKQRIRFA